MTVSDLRVGQQDPAALAPASADVRRLPELAGSAEERRWAESWTAWADLRTPAASEPAQWTPALGTRWAGHRRPRGFRQPPAA